MAISLVRDDSSLRHFNCYVFEFRPVKTLDWLGEGELPRDVSAGFRAQPEERGI
jgi:hypothetical protein